MRRPAPQGLPPRRDRVQGLGVLLHGQPRQVRLVTEEGRRLVLGLGDLVGLVLVVGLDILIGLVFFVGLVLIVGLVLVFLG
ncbi:MAG: hypothetical protein WD834_04845 [Actinomycetota bacterium]